MASNRVAACRLVWASPYGLLCLAGYLVMIGGVVWWLLSARQWALVELATPRSQHEWQMWREDVRRQQSQPGLVQRRVPKSAEPPALVLMRDYFGISLIGAILFTTVLYWVIAWFVTGILQKPNHDGPRSNAG